MKPQMALRGRAANTCMYLPYLYRVPMLPAAPPPHSAAASPRDALQRRRAAPAPSPLPHQDTMPEKRLTRSNHRTGGINKSPCYYRICLRRFSLLHRAVL